MQPTLFAMKSFINVLEQKEINTINGKFPSAQLCIYSGYVIKRPEIVKNGRLGEKSGYRGEILLC